MRRQSTTACLGCFFFFFAGFVLSGCSRNRETDTTEVTDWHEPVAEQDRLLADDQLDEKRLPPFDPRLIDSRPLGDWEVNASAAVVGLDCPLIDPDSNVLVLRKTYSDAISHAPILSMLPSANLVDGAAKQFDDGLYAALDLACYRGELGFGGSAPDVVQRSFRQIATGQSSAALSRRRARVGRQECFAERNRGRSKASVAR